MIIHWLVVCLEHEWIMAFHSVMSESQLTLTKSHFLEGLAATTNQIIINHH